MFSRLEDTLSALAAHTMDVAQSVFLETYVYPLDCPISLQNCATNCYDDCHQRNIRYPLQCQILDGCSILGSICLGTMHIVLPPIKF